MKKLYFLFLFALIASLGGAYAAETTFSFAQKTTEATQDNISIVFAGGSTAAAFNQTGMPNMRLYAGGTLTVSCGDDYKITAISFNARKDKASNTLSVNEAEGVLTDKLSTGTSSFKEDAATWVAAANSEITSIVFTVGGTSGHIGFGEIKVTYETLSTEFVTAPVISGVEEGVAYYGATVGISYPVGATGLTYTIKKDGVGAEQTATEAVSQTITEPGAYTVEASATDGTTVLSATAVNFTVEALEDGTYAIVGENEGATYAMKNETLSAAYYIAATQYDLVAETPSAEHVFTIANVDGGFTIQANDGTYVGLVKSGNYENLNIGLAEPVVFTVSGSVDAAEVAVEGITKYLQFTVFNNTTPEFVADTRYNGVRFVKVDAQEVTLGNPVFSVEEGDYTAEFDLTLTAAGAEEIWYTLDGTDPTAAGVTPLTYNDPIHIGEGTTTVTAVAVDAELNTSDVVSKTYTVTIPVVETSTYKKVTDVASLAAGDKVIFVAEEHSMAMANAVQKANERFASESISLQDGATTFASDKDVAIYTLETGSNGEFKFAKGDAYLCCAEAKKISDASTFEDGADKWLINDDATVTPVSLGTGNFIQYNYNGSMSAFSVYASNAASTEKVVLYKEDNGNPASVNAAKAGQTVIRSTVNGVVVNAAGATVVRVYNAAGAMVEKAVVAAGETTVAVPSGFYIVRAGDAVAKVVVR